MRTAIKSHLGEEVGYVEDNVYYTIRDYYKNQIFKVKHWFNGKHIKTPVGIDIHIIDRLIQNGVENVRITYLHLPHRGRSFTMAYKIKDIINSGVKERFFYKEKLSYGWQLIFELDIGRPYEQKVLGD